MIPFDYITEWRAEAPWIDDAQVEQDLVISRALVEIFRHPALACAQGRRRDAPRRRLVRLWDSIAAHCGAPPSTIT